MNNFKSENGKPDLLSLKWEDILCGRTDWVSTAIAPHQLIIAVTVIGQGHPSSMRACK